MDNLKGKYIERKFIGRSQWADTYTGVNSITKEVVTLKVIINDSTNKEYMENLKREVEMLQDMENANLISINSIENIAGEEKVYPYIESENFSNITLKEKLKDGTFSELEAIKIIKQVADGLKGFHFNNIVYGKLSCDNIYIDDKGIVKIDTLAYLEEKKFKKLSKKQYNGEKDIYSLGMILFELITGDDNLELKKYKNKICDKDILYIIDKCINKKLGIYEDLNEFIMDVNDYLEYSEKIDDLSQEEVLIEENNKKISLPLIISLGVCIAVLCIATIIING